MQVPSWWGWWLMHAGVQVSDKRQGQIWAHKQLLWALAPCVGISGCRIIPRVCMWKWWHALGTLPAWCKGTAGGPCSELAHSGGCQLWGLGCHLSLSLLLSPGLDVSGGSGLQWGQRGERGKGLKQLMIGNQINVVGKLVKSADSSQWPWWPEVPLVPKAAGVVCSVTGNRGHSPCRVEIYGPCFSPLFPAFSICLSFAPLWMGWNQSRSSVWCLEWLGKLVIHSDQVFLFHCIVKVGVSLLA